MDRQGFSELLIKTRESENVSKNQICRLMGLMFHQLQRLERGSNNYNVKLVVSYLAALGYCISLSGHLCYTYQDIITDIADKRSQEQHTVRSIAELLQCSYTFYSRVENEHSLLTIDLFLRIIDVLDLKLEIVKKI